MLQLTKFRHLLRPSRSFFHHFSTFPKHEVVGMPALSPTMEVGTIGKWLKNVGDKVTPGESIAEIETDKASIAFEAQDEFYIAKHLVTAGTEVPVGSPIFISVDDNSTVAAFADYKVTAAEPAKSANQKSTTPTPEQKPAPASAPAPAPAPKPVSTPAPAPAPSSVSASASAESSSPAKSSPPSGNIPVMGIYSVRWGTMIAKGPLGDKIISDQAAYLAKYGRPKPASKKEKK